MHMTRYKQQTDFPDEDASSIGSIHLNVRTSPNMHIRFANRGSFASLWHRRSRLEKYLLIIALVLSILCAMLVIVSLKEAETKTRILHVKQHPYMEMPCLEKQCVFAANDILKSIDEKVDPCDDFYAYACNQWIRNNPIPDGKSMWGTFGKLEQQNQLVVKNVLEKNESYFKSTAEKKAKKYFESCLDTDETMEKLGAKPMLTLLKDIGGWSVTDPNFSVKKWTLQKVLQKLHNTYNMGGLFGWAVGEDDRNSSRHIIQIDQGGLTLPTRDNYINRTAQHEKILVAYLDYMTKISMLLGAKNETTAKKQMQDIIDLETRIAEITVPNEERRDEESLYNLMTLTELQETAPFINWQNHFEDAFRLVNRKISEKEKVVVYAPKFLKDLTPLIENYTKTDEGKTTLHNYLVWQTVRNFAACLSKAFRDAYKNLRKALIGSDGGEEPWRYCVTDTNNVLGFAIGAMFVREVFHGDSKPQAEEMIDEIRTAFKENLKRLNWMDPETRTLAEEKADAISDMIGFPDYILDPKQLDEKYKDLEIDPKQYFDNNLKINTYNLKKNLERLDQPVNKTRWSMSPPTVNAYYTPTKNQVVFPAGILQTPFYDAANPKSLNYGAIGVVVGHEITHAFDDQGREYDKYGNLHQWWNDKTIKKFKDRTDCFVKQYGNYKINDKNLNGKQTLGENIADNGGLKSAYHAFLNSKKNLRPSDLHPLPGLNMTHEQLFFISFAQVWCSAITDETISLQIEKDPHSPPNFRVVGSLSNLPEFSETFNCPIGSPMNPSQKCEVW
ncbi:endothelin-converting enzyme homolog isoform X4 [Chironomus tepperi]|uniref:endothelin-converting enzyme homolog isoform X4 n=1 Tax=Chironomus tepperi TaxID=113505 RepID=UPI00391FCA05